MTDKKEKILESALDLFANKGYDATSTRKVAIDAKVSEGLIFRHFLNKKSLLDTLMAQAEEKVNTLFRPILDSIHPATAIRRTIELPFTIDESEYDFWRLYFKMKWEAEYNNPHKSDSLIRKLTGAFKELGYTDPANEARLLNQILDIVSTEILKGHLRDKEKYRDFLLEKYKV